MKNYYELLEVDKNASKEVIDKAYKILVKKYHPDLQDESSKLECEHKIKEINEAYDILSDTLKRNEYDKTLKNNFITLEDYNILIDENMKLKKELNNLKNTFFNKNTHYDNYQNINKNNFNNSSTKYKPNNFNNTNNIYNNRSNTSDDNYNKNYHKKDFTNRK